jgi:tetratricopeptide (TPR) repeat protein
MTTSVTTAPPAAPKATPWERLVAWATAHRQAVAYAGAMLAIAAVLFVWNLLSTRTAERSAERQLAQGRLALSSKNYPLAASVLAQVVENFSGTHAAEEGNLVLAQVRLAQGQPQQAIDRLKVYAPKAGRDYRAQAYGLLGAAYENAGHPRDGAAAYEQAATLAPYPFLRAQFLSNAGRAWVAGGDTAKAVAAYRTIVDKLDSAAVAPEAKVRLGELTRGAVIVAGGK